MGLRSNPTCRGKIGETQSGDPDGIVLWRLTRRICSLLIKECQDLRSSGLSSTVIPTKDHSGEED